MSSHSYNEFQREGNRIDELVWAALAIAPKSHVLFCGFENARAIIERALREGTRVTVIDSNSEALSAAEGLGAKVIRGSTSSIQYRGEAFDVAVAHYYLHKVDPSFHPQIITELGRVARRVAIVEPGPPTDLLGSRIASLYARAKRDLGEFEQYQDVEHWRRMLSSIRPAIVPSTIAYGALPPRAFLRDTIRIMLDLMRIGGIRDEELRELQALAAASDSQMLPQPRYVLLAAASLAEIPARPRMAELEAMAPNVRRTIPTITSGNEKISSRRSPKLPLDEAEYEEPTKTASATARNVVPASAPVAIARAVKPVAPIAPAQQPASGPKPAAPAPAYAPFAFTKPAAETATPLFGIPQIPESNEVIDDLFKPPGGRSHWDQDDLPEMPDFGFNK